MEREKKHMSQWGVGPIYVSICFILTIGGILVVKNGILHKGNIEKLSTPLKLLAIICIIIGLTLWISSVIIGKIDKHIKENKLLTTGVYAWVRNPIYSAFAFIFTGILFWQNNIFLFIFPVIFWGIMTILVKKEEKILLYNFGQEYINYSNKVNRCIPWIPKK